MQRSASKIGEGGALTQLRSAISKRLGALDVKEEQTKKDGFDKVAKRQRDAEESVRLLALRPGPYAYGQVDPKGKAKGKKKIPPPPEKVGTIGCSKGSVGGGGGKEPKDKGSKERDLGRFLGGVAAGPDALAKGKAYQKGDKTGKERDEGRFNGGVTAQRERERAAKGKGGKPRMMIL